MIRNWSTCLSDSPFSGFQIRSSNSSIFLLSVSSPLWKKKVTINFPSSSSWNNICEAIFKLRTIDLYLPEACLGLLLDTGNLLEFHPCQQVKFSVEGRTPKSRKMCPKKSKYIYMVHIKYTFIMHMYIFFNYKGNVSKCIWNYSFTQYFSKILGGNILTSLFR